jgi:gliding motility-associated protein GldM
MKTCVLIIALAINSIFIMAQASGKKAVFSVAKPNKVIAVSPTKMAVLYRGVDNPVEIAISDVPIKYISATVDSGEVQNLGEGNFVVTINKAVRYTKINVFETYNGVTTKVGEKLFRVKKVPDPVANIANTSGGAVSKDVLVAAAGIIPVMKDFDFELSFTVSSFTMTIQKPGGDLVSYIATNNRLTPQMVAALKAAQPGLKVYFEDIKAIGPEGVCRSLSSICLKLI